MVEGSQGSVPWGRLLLRGLQGQSLPLEGVQSQVGTSLLGSQFDLAGPPRANFVPECPARANVPTAPALVSPPLGQTSPLHRGRPPRLRQVNTTELSASKSYAQSFSACAGCETRRLAGGRQSRNSVRRCIGSPSSLYLRALRPEIVSTVDFEKPPDAG